MPYCDLPNWYGLFLTIVQSIFLGHNRVYVNKLHCNWNHCSGEKIPYGYLEKLGFLLLIKAHMEILPQAELIWRGYNFQTQPRVWAKRQFLRQPYESISPEDFADRPSNIRMWAYWLIMIHIDSLLLQIGRMLPLGSNPTIVILRVNLIRKMSDSHLQSITSNRRSRLQVFPVHFKSI